MHVVLNSSSGAPQTPTESALVSQVRSGEAQCVFVKSVEWREFDGGVKQKRYSIFYPLNPASLLNLTHSEALPEH